MVAVMEDSCKDVGVLDAKIKGLERRQDAIERSITDALTRVEGMFKDLSDKVDTQMANLSIQTNNQETEIRILRNDTEQQERRIQAVEDKISAHGIRLAQVATIAVVASLLLPVIFEQWLTDRPLQSEIGYAHD